MDACVIKNYQLPKVNQKSYYCISCANHLKLKKYITFYKN